MFKVKITARNWEEIEFYRKNITRAKSHQLHIYDDVKTRTLSKVSREHKGIEFVSVLLFINFLLDCTGIETAAMCL